MHLPALRWPLAAGLILFSCQVLGTAGHACAQQTPIRWPAAQGNEPVQNNNVRFVPPTIPSYQPGTGNEQAVYQQPIIGEPAAPPRTLHSGVMQATYLPPVAEENRSPSAQPIRREVSVLTRRSDTAQPAAARTTAATRRPTIAPPGANANARQLLVYAHKVSQTAENEQELTQVIDACRQTLAAGPAQAMADYAAKLASWALNRRGQLRTDQQRENEALADFETAVRLDPSRWRAVHNRGVLLAGRGQFEQAFDDFNYTIQINPMFAKAYSNRAALFVQAGELQAALKDYGRAISLDKNLTVAHRGSGKVCHLLGYLDRALDHYDASVELDPSNAYTLARRAELLFDMGRYAEADIDYERAIKLDPYMPEAYRGSAWLLATCPDRRIRHAELALERAERAIELNKNKDPLYYDTLAAAQASAGEFRAAVQSGNRAAALAPEGQRSDYEYRVSLYEGYQPYRTAPYQPVQQAGYQQ